MSIYRNKTILVTGGTGSIGSEIVKQLIKTKAKEIRVYSRDEFKHFLLQQELHNKQSSTIIKYVIGDVRDYDRLEESMLGCDFVFHAGAMKHISFCEEDPNEAIKTNIIGSQNVIRAAIKNNVSHVIGISTDKAANPTTFMGKTKLVMEGIFTAQRSSKTKFCIVRLGNIINSRGSVVPIWLDQIQRGLNITITDKRMIRFLMEADEASRLIIQAGEISKGREIFVIRMVEKNIFELAQKIIQKYAKGKSIGINIIGARYGEKLREELLTKEEKGRAKEAKNYFIILPDLKVLAERKTFYEKL